MAHSHLAPEVLEPRRLFAANPAVLSTVVNPANGHTYHLLEAATWAEAQAKAITLNGHLATINNADEQAFVWNTFSPSADVIWIGYNDTDRDGVYQWVSGEPSTYTNWFAGEPNGLWDPGEQWATMWVDYNGAWNDLGAESPQGPFHPAVVEVASGGDLFGSVTPPPVIAATGTSFNATATVRNGGSSTVTATLSVQFYLSTDGTFDDGVDVLVGSAITNGSALPFNASTTAAGTVAVPQILTAGRYHLLAVVDAAGSVAESDETNNVVDGGIVDVGATRTPVIRNLVGYVRDGDGGALNGVRVTYDGRTAFTDYDKGSKLDKEVNGDFLFLKAVVGHNVSFNGSFSHFRATGASETPLELTAQDLAGNTYTNTLSVADVLPFDANLKDGGIAKFVATDVLFIGDYGLRSGTGDILLHKDLRNDKNSVRPQLKSPKQLAAGRRFRDTVEAVTLKLGQLGFRDGTGAALAASDSIAKGSASLTAVQLFDDILRGYAAADPTSTAKVKPATGVIDEAFIAALNGMSTSTAQWIATPPAGWTVASGLANTFINRATELRLASLASAVPAVTSWTLSNASPATGGTTSLGFPAGIGRAGADIAFGWINTSGVGVSGTKFWEPVSGQSESAVKLIGGKKVAIPDPSQLGVTWQYRSDYDAAATRSVIEALLAGGNVRVAFNDPQILTALNAVTIAGSKVTVLRADITPAAGFDVHVGARIKG